MATVRQLESGGYQAVVRRKGVPAQYKSFEKKAEAVEWATLVERDIRRGSYLLSLNAERTSFAEVADRFAVEFALQHYRVRADNKEAWRFQLKHLRNALGDYALTAITPQLVAKFRDTRLKVVSGTTVRKEINLLSKVLTVATHEFGIILLNGNPVANVRKPSESRGRDRRLIGDEAERLLVECRASRNLWLLPAVMLALETAMRQGELLSMNWRDVDLKRQMIMLYDTKNREDRAVPISTAAAAVLQSIPKHISGVVLPVERMTLFHAFQAACKRAGIKGMTFHDLRHEALSRLAERGDLSTLELAAISGHKTLQMLKRYTHLQAEKLAQKLNGVSF